MRIRMPARYPARGCRSIASAALLVTCSPMLRKRAGSARGRPMTYCVGIWTKDGLVMASDSRTNAGHDQVNVSRKMHTFVQPGERVFILLSSGSLSCTQSIITLLKRDFDQGKGLAQAPSLYDAARVIGEQVRRVSDMDRDALERDDFKFNVNLVLGGQVSGGIAGPLHHLSPGQPAAGQRGLALSADRRDQVRPAHPRPRHPLPPHHPGGGGQVRAAVARLDHALERDGGPADRPARLRGGRARDHPAPSLPRERPGPDQDRHPLGAGPPPGGGPAAPDPLPGPTPGRGLADAARGDDRARRAGPGRDRRASSCSRRPSPHHPDRRRSERCASTTTSA